MLFLVAHLIRKRHGLNCVCLLSLYHLNIASERNPLKLFPAATFGSVSPTITVRSLRHARLQSPWPPLVLRLHNYYLFVLTTTFRNIFHAYCKIISLLPHFNATIFNPLQNVENFTYQPSLHHQVLLVRAYVRSFCTALST